MGPKYTVPLVARYADVWNIPTYGLADHRRSAELLDAECLRVDRDPASIRRSHQAILAIAENDRELPEVEARARRHYGADAFGLDEGYVGTPAMLVDSLAGRAEQGIDSVVFMAGAKHAAATMELFAAEVMPHIPG